jgi:hypothetical protein
MSVAAASGIVRPPGLLVPHTTLVPQIAVVPYPGVPAVVAPQTAPVPHSTLFAFVPHTTLVPHTALVPHATLPLKESVRFPDPSFTAVGEMAGAVLRDVLSVVRRPFRHRNRFPCLVPAMPG